MKVIVTGGAGFIGSAFVWKLNQEGVSDILIVDELGTDEKWKNLVGLRYSDFLHKDVFLRKVQEDTLAFHPYALVHMGACSATTERDADYLMENNYRYTKTLAEWSVANGVRYIYASSGATYGDGALGFSDDPLLMPRLHPINMYGYSKHLFDLYARRTGLIEKIVGLKFFNVFGPNEYHKGKMTSRVFKGFHEVKSQGFIQLFKSEHPDYNDGEQVRDFVYVKDCVEVMWWLLQHNEVNGVYNVGTGTARTWNDLSNAIFAALGKEAKIEYIPMPDELRRQYQYRTEADLARLQEAGCPVDFHTLEDAVRDYVNHYLETGAYLSVI